MLFSCDWLSAYVDLPDDREDLARRLTAAGFAVELIDQSDDGDTVFDIDVTTNRVDAMNHLGLAREVAVLTGAPLREPGDSAGEPDESDELTADAVRVELDAPTLCSRYAARVVRGVSIGPSPDWMARRLRAIGLRPINNVVDVTNYVMWEMGQPLHAFDLDKISPVPDAATPSIVVRRAHEGEILTTLDGAERELASDMLVIADGARAVALAGVMGGEDSEVVSSTHDILLESAWFDPQSVRRTAKRLGMHTDASHRFERGVDPELQARATTRAAALIAELGGGTVLAGVVDAVAPEHEERCRARTIALDLDRLDEFGGIEIPEGKAEEWLTGLGCSVETTGPRTLAVTVPSWRLFDLEEPADLYEEALRIHGFDAIPSTLPDLGRPDAPPTPRQELRRRLRRELSGCGFAEAINWAFHSPEEAASLPPLGEGAADEGPVALANPLSELYSVMRRSLLPGLVANAHYNARRGVGSVRLFELGHTFGRALDPAGSPTENGSGDGTVVERESLALVAGGTLGTPWEHRIEIDLFDLKGVLEELAFVAGKRLEARPADGLPGLLPGASAELYFDGRRAGVLGHVAGEEVGFPLFVAELELDALSSSAEERAAAREVDAPPRLPGIDVDLTFTHALATPWSEIEQVIDERKTPDLVRFRLKDRYTGKGVPQGAVNTTIAFHYHGGERQLTQDEVNAAQTSLAAVLEERFGLGQASAGHGPEEGAS